MKKRTLIVIIITIISIILLNKYWIVFNPAHVSLDITGENKCNIEVLLNKKDNDAFKKVKRENIEINLNENNHADIYVNRAKSPKRAKLIISDIKTKNKLYLSNIAIENFKLDNLNKFEISNANVIIQGDKIILTPNGDTVSLTYLDTLNVKPNIKFNFEIFVIIVVLSFLLAYKLSDYIADFKTVKRKSRLDIFFLIAFFIFLFIPMSHINKNAISTEENRTLAKLQPFIKENNEINLKFGKFFNEWFEDRFFLRDTFIKQYYTLLSYFSKDYYENATIIYNKHADFSYNKAFNSLNRYLKKDLFTEQELNLIQKNISTLKKYCDDNNVQLYIILSSDKESIYPEYYPTYYNPNNNISRLEQVKELLKTIPNLKVISQYENLIEAKKNNMLFLPYDTHLNAIGSYIEYTTIISELKKSYSNLYPIKFSETEVLISNHKGDSLPPEQYINKKYLYTDSIKLKTPIAEHQNELIFEEKSYSFNEYINNNANNNLKIVIIGDSFHTKYVHLLAENPYMLKSLFVGFGKDFILDKPSKDILFKEKPDILLIETCERFLPRFLKMDTFFDIFNSKQE